MAIQGLNSARPSKLSPRLFCGLEIATEDTAAANFMRCLTCNHGSERVLQKSSISFYINTFFNDLDVLSFLSDKVACLPSLHSSVPSDLTRFAPQLEQLRAWPQWELPGNGPQTA